MSHPQVGGGTPILPAPRGGSLSKPWSAVLGKGNWRLHSGLGMRFSYSSFPQTTLLLGCSWASSKPFIKLIF